MDDSRFLDDFARRLRRAGLPRDYVQSSVGELREHLEDAQGAHDATTADVLGDSRELASAYVLSYRSSSVVGRFPFASLFLGGAVVAALCQLGGMALWLAVCGLSAKLSGRLTFETGVTTPASAPALVVGGWSVVQIVNALAVSLAVPLMLRAARRAGRGRAGLCLALFWPALFAPCTPITLRVPVQAPPGQSFVFTYGLAWGEIALPPLLAVVVPLWLSTVVVRRWCAQRPRNGSGPCAIM